MYVTITYERGVNMKRMILRGVKNVSSTDVYELLPNFDNIKIKRIWSILNEEKMFAADKFNPQTGEKIEFPIPRTLDNPLLNHGTTAFLEDFIHDWNVRGGKFVFYSRIVKEGDEIDLLVEYEEN